MTAQRTFDERLTDAALLLTLWTRAAKDPTSDAGDRLRQMKLAFLAAHRLQEERVRALNLSFYRWTWGPMSNEVYDAWNDLERGGFLEDEERFVITDDGAELADSFYNEVVRDEHNVPVRRAFDAIAAEWKPKQSTSAILNHVYAMEMAVGDSEARVPMKRIVEGTNLLAPIPAKQAVSRLYVSNAWIETLALEFNPAARARLAAATADFRAGRYIVA